LASLVTVNILAWGIGLLGGPAAMPADRLIAEMLSSSAIVLMSSNVVLATRPLALDRFFGGLDKLFVSHRLNGLAVAAILLGHFTLMPKSTGWVPSKLVAYPNLTLLLVSIALAVAPRSPWKRLVTLRYNHWKLEHRFMGVFLAAGLAHSVLAHPILLGLPATRLWVYGVGTLGVVTYLYRELGECWFKERHVYRVGTPVHVAADVLEIELKPAARPIAHRSGQFAFVRFADGPSAEQHPFTLSAAPVRDHALRLSIRASGDFTRNLQTHLSSGSSVRVEGPYGGFDYRTGKSHQLWIAGGIGITPFLAFLGDFEDGREVSLVWSVRTRSEAPYLAEIERAVAEQTDIRFKLHVSSEQGRLSIPTLGLERPERLSAYLCGPVPMRKSLAEQLQRTGVPRREIHYEEFSLR
jgi:predicted ferric reductase